jgi:hypothetical protein
MGIADLFKKAPPKGAPVADATNALNVKIAYSGMSMPLAANLEALLAAHGEPSTQVITQELPGGAPLRFFTLRRKGDAPVDGRRLVLHVYSCARPSQPDAVKSLVMGASALVVSHLANESVGIDREWLAQARAASARELPVVVQVVYPEAFVRMTGSTPEGCDASAVRDGLGLPPDCPVFATSRPPEAAIETFEAAVQIAVARAARA